MQAKKSMIFSMSGWRTIISESENPFDIPQHILTTLYYGIYSYIEMKQKSLDKTQLNISIACDSRLSGIVLLALAEMCIKEKNCSSTNLGMIPIPALLAYTKEYADGFIYFSASHNPKEYNGIKYGSGEGKVQGKTDNDAMMAIFIHHATAYTEIPPQITHFMKHIPTFPVSMSALVIDEHSYALAYTTYKKLVIKSVFKGISAEEHEFKTRLNAYQKKHGYTLGVLLDPNGGARTWKGDISILSDFGIECSSIHTTTSQYHHAIIPEGESLKQARDALIHINATQNDCFYPMAVVCDCDGDRGNTIFMSTHSTQVEGNPTRDLEAQEVFATILEIELAWAKYTLSKQGTRVAVAVNGPSSLRCDRIAKKYNAHIARGEVGEANIVSCGEELRKNGYSVPLVGEASNGGIIMFPSAVRDPLCTILSLFKAMLWAEELNLDERILSIVESLPLAHTSTTEDPLAKFSLPDLPYQDISAMILNNFEAHFKEFIALFKKAHMDISDYAFVHFEGTKEVRIKRGEQSKYCLSSGGLAIRFFKDNESEPCAFVWLRPSGTEPVVRLLVDILDVPHSNSKSVLKALQCQWRDYLETILFT